MCRQKFPVKTLEKLQTITLGGMYFIKGSVADASVNDSIGMQEVILARRRLLQSRKQPTLP
jgi:hypothetical protein